MYPPAPGQPLDAALAAGPARPLTGSAAAVEIHRQLNRTAVAYPRDASVPTLFRSCAARWPCAPAVVQGGRVITYRQLDLLTNGLARDLQANGVTPGMSVGVCLPRSPELIVALLAVLKCGGSYLPLDAGWPEAHLATLVAAAGCGTVLTSGMPGAPRRLGQSRVLCVRRGGVAPSEAGPDIPVAADDVAYVNFTSGSTGTPKGVPIRHRSIARLTFGARYARLDHASRLLQLAPVTFDAATFEIWGALLHGGTCVLYPGRFLRVSELAQVVRTHGITVLFITTALFNVVIDEMPAAFGGVSTILTGGETHSVRHMAKALRAYGPGRLVNVYGPTESATFATYHPVNELPDDAVTLPIGRPIQNTRLYVVDGDALCGPGRVGELCLAGDGLSPGYLGMPELTADKFVHRVIDGTPERLYRTGDHGYLLPSGDAVFLGRHDDQVKINGFRIELGEIAHHLDRAPAVRQSHVTVSGDRAVVAFVVGGGPECTPASLRDHLRARLPAHMLPARIHLCETLPLTPSGKVDHQALLARHDGNRPADAAPAPP
jgi:amino acid adenylation domain-containing protein